LADKTAARKANEDAFLLARRNTSNAAYLADNPTTVERPQSDVSMSPTFYGTYVAPESSGE
jgi:hypothetical protein